MNRPCRQIARCTFPTPMPQRGRLGWGERSADSDLASATLAAANAFAWSAARRSRCSRRRCNAAATVATVEIVAMCGARTLQRCNGATRGQCARNGTSAAGRDVRKGAPCARAGVCARARVCSYACVPLGGDVQCARQGFALTVGVDVGGRHILPESICASFCEAFYS